MSKGTELLKKLKALADQGIGGEKVNAQRILNNLLKKEGLLLTDLEDEEVRIHYFKVRKMYRRLFYQIVGSIRGESVGWKRRDLRGKIGIECNQLEVIEIQAKYNFYLRLYKKEMEVFFAAFIGVYSLYEKGKGRDWSELTEEEKDLIDKAGKMAQGITKENYHKQIKHKN